MMNMWCSHPVEGVRGRKSFTMSGVVRRLLGVVQMPAVRGKRLGVSQRFRVYQKEIWAPAQ